MYKGQYGGTGENTPFAVQSRKNERDNGHDNKQNLIGFKHYIPSISVIQTW